jgi:ABC-2 type transport system permease protein
MWKRIRSLIIKELLTVLRDPIGRFSILVPPLIQLFIFGFAATLDVKNASIGILNRDSGEQAFELVERFQGSPVFTDITHLNSVEQIAPFIENQKGIMVVSIDEQFSRNLDAKKPATVQLIFDGRKSNTAQVLSGYTTSIVERFNADYSAEARIQQENVRLISRNWFNPNITYYWYNFPSLVATLSMFTCLVITAQSVARERELETFNQLLVSPLVPGEIVVGKVMPGIVIGMFEGLLMMTCAILLFHVPFNGSFMMFLISLFVFVCSISGIGLFISSICKTQQQALLGTFVFGVPAILLSGYATPIENMPPWLQPVTYFIPLRYMLFISKGIFLKGVSAEIVFSRIWPMIVIAFCNLLGAGLFFRRRLE